MPSWPTFEYRSLTQPYTESKKTESRTMKRSDWLHVPPLTPHLLLQLLTERSRSTFNVHASSQTRYIDHRFACGNHPTGCRMMV